MFFYFYHWKRIETDESAEKPDSSEITGDELVDSANRIKTVIKGSNNEKESRSLLIVKCVIHYST